MTAIIHCQHDRTELRKVHILPCLQWMSHEKRTDDIAQMLERANAIRHPVTVINAHDAASEMLFESMQDLNVTLVLHDGEFRQDLEADTHFRMRVDPHV